MPRPALRPTVLSFSGIIAIVIGTAIVADPVGFHATGGVHVGADAGLLNEMRAAGGAILSLGLLALVAVFANGLRTIALTASAAVYGGYGLARLYSFLVDGVPDRTLVWIAALELVICAACFAVAVLPQAPKSRS